MHACMGGQLSTSSDHRLASPCFACLACAGRGQAHSLLPVCLCVCVCVQGETKAILAEHLAQEAALAAEVALGPALGADEVRE